MDTTRRARSRSRYLDAPMKTDLCCPACRQADPWLTIAIPNWPLNRDAMEKLLPPQMQHMFMAACCNTRAFEAGVSGPGQARTPRKGRVQYATIVTKNGAERTRWSRRPSSRLWKMHIVACRNHAWVSRTSRGKNSREAKVWSSFVRRLVWCAREPVLPLSHSTEVLAIKSL